MKQILLIAWREYRQYIFSRGFLIFLLMFPLGFIAVSAAVGLAEANKPSRNFVVYDQVGGYGAAIVEEIDHRMLHVGLMAWDEYLRAFADDPDAFAAPFAPGTINELRITRFEAAGGFPAAIAAAQGRLKEGAPQFTPPKRPFHLVDLPEEAAAAGSLDEAKEILRPYLLEEKTIALPGGERDTLFAAILIPADFSAAEGAQAAQYWSRNLTDSGLESRVSSALNKSLRRQTIAELGVPDAALEQIEAIDAPMTSFRPDRAPGEAELTLADRIETGLPAAMTYMLLVIIFGVGNLLLTNTIEERSNKIVEILLSSVTANQLMMGKLIGIGAVGLTMPAIFVAGGVGLSATIDTGGQESVATSVMNTLLSSNLLAVYLFYFLCAYVIFAMLFLAIGAISNSLQDAQSYMGPVMLLVFAPLPFMLMVFQNPNGVVASILTWIPIYTPYAVMMRAAADPPMWEILGATAFMLAFGFFLMRIMGRIFRNAILNASPPKMTEVWRLAKKEGA